MRRHFNAMVSSKLAVFSLLAGIVLGCAAVPAVSAAAEQLQIQRTPHPICLDGEPVELEAYAIDGYNYVKLRDIARVLGLEVYWDGSAAQIVTGGAGLDAETCQNASRALRTVNEMKNGVYQWSSTTCAPPTALCGRGR